MFVYYLATKPHGTLRDSSMLARLAKLERETPTFADNAMFSRGFVSGREGVSLAPSRARVSKRGVDGCHG